VNGVKTGTRTPAKGCAGMQFSCDSAKYGDGRH